MDKFVRSALAGRIAQSVASRVPRRIGIFVIGGAATLIVACGGSDSDPAPTNVVDQPRDNTPVAAAPDPTVTPTPERVQDIETPSPKPTIAPADPGAVTDIDIDDDVERARAVRLRDIWGWDTNLNERTISLNELEIVLPRDRITPIDEPTFASVSAAPDYMEAREPVVAVIVDGDARAYPLAILMWHEIVNDKIGGVPVTVTFCPLCNTGITFKRVIDGEELTFGTSGMLRRSDLVMWDRQTQSFWQQITGEALAGDYAASETVLEQLPSSIIAWETFADAYPDGKLLERLFDDNGFQSRQYDNPPYAGYDNVDNQPFLFSGAIDGRLVATSRVLTIDGEVPVAYPFSFLKETPVLNDVVNGDPVTAFFDNGTFSAFKGTSGNDQTVGSVAVFSRILDGRTLTFESSDSAIIDLETGSEWNLAGVSTAGELEGSTLKPVVHANHFWFAWAVFKPETLIRDSAGDLTS